MSYWQKVVKTYNDISKLNPLSAPTWLAIGAALQLLSLSLIPAKLSNLFPLLYLGYRVLKAANKSKRIYTSSFATVKRGRWTAELSRAEDSSSDNGVVMFVLGARFNHPFGVLAPGAKEIGKLFEKMWLEAENNREKWGYLGRTSTLVDTSDTEGTTITWLSYWKNPQGLHEFSTSTAHHAGMIAYNAKKFPHTGIMHETFHAPKGCWESIYDNMPLWGLGKIAEKLETFYPKSSSIEHSSMLHRMRKNK